VTQLRNPVAHIELVGACLHAPDTCLFVCTYFDEKDVRFQGYRCQTRAALPIESLYWASNPVPTGCEGGRSTCHCRCPVSWWERYCIL